MMNNPSNQPQAIQQFYGATPLPQQKRGILARLLNMRQQYIPQNAPAMAPKLK